ncbi:MAG: hypothetical protein IJ446_10995 [Oscillospiraceae bacterium]|nr:hypothetical protein [Oscillospiraceae bacterium]
MQTGKKRMIRSVSAVVSAAVMTGCLIPAAAYTEQTSVSEVIQIVETVSDSGYAETKYIDANGNEVEFDLIPDIQMADCYASYFNLYDENRVTDVKNQGNHPLCWCFAGMASAESSLITGGFADNNVDLSEKYVAWFANGAPPPESDPLYGDVIYDLGTGAYNRGGNLNYVVYVLSRGSGPVYEERVPYSTTSALSEELRYCADYRIMDMQNYSPDDRASIKNALVEHGALSLSYYSDDNLYYNKETSSYYCSNDVTTNHAVTLIGWDDEYSADNFRTAPAGDGAWIIKNSWGTDWGDDGIFYLSYYDASIGVVGGITMTSEDSWNNVYQYDGKRGKLLPSSSELGASGANIFTAKSDEILNGVSFWTEMAELSYRISIYTDIPEGGDPTSGTLVHTQNGSEMYSGYHTVMLDDTVELSQGDRFSVVVDLFGENVKFTADSYAACKGVSFFANYDTTGRSAWLDTSSNSVLQCNVCIKAMTSNVSDIGVCIDKTSFPDDIFREFVSSYDINSNGYLSKRECEAVTSVDVKCMGIADLKGIEYFTEITDLVCYGNKLTGLDLTGNTKLVKLNCHDNELTSLDIYKCTSLTEVYCNDNMIKSLDFSFNPQIQFIQCCDNQLVALNVTGCTALKTLNCDNNYIETLDLSDNAKLFNLHCKNNSLAYIDITDNPEIIYFFADGNVYGIGNVKDSFSPDVISGFDPDKISDVRGAEYDPELNAFVNFEGLTVTYTYDCGQGKNAVFTLKADSFTSTEPDIQYYIDIVNAIEADTVILTAEQLEAVEKVLEYDYSK